MKGTRSPLECRLAFFNDFHPSINQEKLWGEGELSRLSEIAKKHDYKDWRTIAKELGVSVDFTFFNGSVWGEGG